jgi:lipid-A-disaccharide synthase
MVIAGEASGDELAAELVQQLRLQVTDAAAAATTDYQPLHASLEPRFFGAGGPRMAAAGVELAFDLTADSVTGFWEVIKKLPTFRRHFFRLLRMALQREPDALICVDFGGFNLRFAHAIRNYVRRHSDWFHDWQPKIIQYVSPQVWASREGRAYKIARDHDLLLTMFPFEKEWYAQRVPQLPVEFVGHPIVNRYGSAAAIAQRPQGQPPAVLLLPGSRKGELKRHLPVMIRSLALMRASIPDLAARMVLPSQPLVQQARQFGLPGFLDLQLGGLPEALGKASVAIACTGTVTLECAFFGVPAVALYKTSWGTYEFGKRIATVKYMAMPNILANEEVFPEFIQHAATPEKIAGAALELLRDEARQTRIRTRLAELVKTLGTPGASKRAAGAIVRVLSSNPKLESRLPAETRLLTA